MQLLHHGPADRAGGVVFAFYDFEAVWVTDKQVSALILALRSKLDGTTVVAHQQNLTVFLEFSR
jgi:hypothetical protein